MPSAGRSCSRRRGPPTPQPRPAPPAPTTRRARFHKADTTTLDVPEATLDAITAFYSFNHIPPAEHADFIVKTAIWLRPVGLLLACLRTGGSNDDIEHWLGVPMFFASHDQDTNRPHLAEA